MNYCLKSAKKLRPSSACIVCIQCWYFATLFWKRLSPHSARYSLQREKIVKRNYTSDSQSTSSLSATAPDYNSGAFIRAAQWAGQQPGTLLDLDDVNNNLQDYVRRRLMLDIVEQETFKEA
jgi:hypothetical protein